MVRQQTGTFIRIAQDIMQQQHMGMQQAINQLLKNKEIVIPERIRQAQKDIAEGGIIL